MCYPEETREEGRRKSMIAAIRCCCVSNEKEAYIRHQQQCRFPSFFLPFFLFAFSFTRLVFPLYVLPHIQLYERVKAKKKRPVTTAAALAKYVSSHHHHHYYSSINYQSGKRYFPIYMYMTYSHLQRSYSK